MLLCTVIYKLNNDAHDILYLTHPLFRSINKIILAKCEYVTKVPLHGCYLLFDLLF